MHTTREAGVLATLIIFASLALAQPAHAATSITRAQVTGSLVRIEGSGAAPNASIFVNGGWLSGRADGGGGFRIESSTFTLPANCRVTVSDGTTTATARLSGCTL